MEKKKDDEATPKCGDQVKRLIAKQFGKNTKPLKFKLKQSDTEKGCVKIKLNDGRHLSFSYISSKHLVEI